jgi:hypothetical protein
VYSTIAEFGRVKDTVKKGYGASTVLDQIHCWLLLRGSTCRNIGVDITLVLRL